MKSFIAFKEFNLLNDNFLLVTDDGIYRFYLNYQSYTLIYSFENKIEPDMIEYADINRFSEDKGGYIYYAKYFKIYI